MAEGLSITTTEMHTAGEPFRIIESGYPDVKGVTLLDKMRYIRENLDSYRKCLMCEPRGHSDMFGVLLVKPDDETAVFGAIFMNNDGYSSMCGHGIISLGRFAVDKGFIKSPRSPETSINIQCPCGTVQVFVEYDGKNTGRVRFHSVPSFVFATDFEVNVPDYGNITVDIAYGGAFYAIVPAECYGLDVTSSATEKLRHAAGATTDALRKILRLEHPKDSDLAFLHGTIMTDGRDAYSEDFTANMCVFAEREVDRSPCGSGVTARTALQYHRKQIAMGQKRQFRGPTSAMFTAGPVKEVTYGKYTDAVVIEVSGKGFYTGTSKFTLEEDDVIGRGFLL